MAQYVFLTALAGFLLPLQALINARLASHLTGPVSAAVSNFATGLIALLAIVAMIRLPAPSAAQFAATPWWSWIGGVFGAFFIFVGTIAVPKLGTASFFAVVITLQLMASLVYDHFGILQTAHPLTLERLLGAVLLIAGAYLILRQQM